ncbi:SWIB-domain-containing protein [Rozella allomycis CSF55]|uniref:SWIB-domain-containing protein n=1 Tax=Rozella allomycis (strain CSF55) TaxID=988480 RepID=A0A075B0Y8_ROZAC|nr:SWIB/MDM2 domain-containing protein [Rozella allomycis CSF55]RKP21868.1 SWIB-domain-containing protein [Rozella allomycis CSF55]|eukprot:EPZ36176.1 SWIB/MDM2 domain-containing protein [Rozella allomycis CSF55]
MDFQNIRSYLEKEYLVDKDLENTTAKNVRNDLEKHFNTDLKPYKKELQEILVDVIVKMQKQKRLDEEQEENRKKIEEQDRILALKLQELEERGLRSTRRTVTSKSKQQSVERKKRKNTNERKNTGFSKKLKISKTLANLLGSDEPRTRAQVVKEVWNYIKENELQDPKNKRHILCDDKLFAVMKRKKIDGFQMNGPLSLHLYTDEEVKEYEIYSSTDDEEDEGSE